MRLIRYVVVPPTQTLVLEFGQIRRSRVCHRYLLLCCHSELHRTWPGCSRLLLEPEYSMPTTRAVSLVVEQDAEYARPPTASSVF